MDDVGRVEAQVRVRKGAWSRERCEDLRAVALMQDDAESAMLIDAAVELLLDVRQSVRGGRRNVRGSRHWEDV